MDNYVMRDTYLVSDYRSLALHKAVAQKIEQDPSLLQKAIDNIERWKKQNNYSQPYLDEWLEHINLGLQHLLVFMQEKTEEAARLRSSSPFVGIITQEERDEIFRKYNDKRSA